MCILFGVPVTLFFLPLCSDLDEIWHEDWPLDPNNRKNTEVWLPCKIYFTQCTLHSRDCTFGPYGYLQDFTWLKRFQDNFMVAVTVVEL